MDQETEGLLYFLLLLKPSLTAQEIYKYWKSSKIFMDYKRPKKQELEKVYIKLRAEVLEMRKVKRNNKWNQQ